MVNIQSVSTHKPQIALDIQFSNSWSYSLSLSHHLCHGLWSSLMGIQTRWASKSRTLWIDDPQYPNMALEFNYWPWHIWLMHKSTPQKKQEQIWSLVPNVRVTLQSQGQEAQALPYKGLSAPMLRPKSIRAEANWSTDSSYLPMRSKQPQKQTTAARKYTGHYGMYDWSTKNTKINI